MAEYFAVAEAEPDMWFAARLSFAASIDPRRLNQAWQCVLQSRDDRTCSAALPETPLRCRLDDNDSKAVWFEFHHGAADGIGATRLIAQTLWIYANGPGGRLAKSHSFHGKATTPRSADADGKPPRFGQTLHHLRVTIAGHNASLYRDAGPVPPPNASTQTTLPSPTAYRGHTVVQTRVDRGTDEGLTQLSRRTGIPINDLVVAAAIEATGELVPPAAGRHIAIMNPVDLRGRGQRLRTANTIGLALVRRTHEQIGAPDLIAGVHDQMTHVRKHGVASELESGLALLRRIPWFGVSAWRLARRSSMFCPTMLVTVMAASPIGRRSGTTGGELKIVDSLIIPPLGGGVDLSMALWRMGDQMKFSLRGSHSTRGDARDVIGAVAQRVLARLDNYATAGPSTDHLTTILTPGNSAESTAIA